MYAALKLKAGGLNVECLLAKRGVAQVMNFHDFVVIAAHRI